MANNESVYESMFILDSNRYARDPSGVSGQIAEMIEKCGGEVLASRLWNEQRLAYPIQGHRKGTYWLAYFRMNTSQLSNFNRTCQLNENVMRKLTLKVEPRLVDTLVAHARGERIDAVTEEASAEKTTEPVAVPGTDDVDLEAANVDPVPTTATDDPDTSAEESQKESE